MLMITIKEIAALAGVSRGTVDRVLNNRGGVNEDVEQRVREVAEHLNYVPNKAGKSLAARKRNLKFGFMLLNSASCNPFLEDVLAGARERAEEIAEFGATVLFRQTTLGRPEEQIQCIKDLEREDINGLVIMPENDRGVRAAIDALTDHGIPVVTVNTDIEGSKRIAYVGSDYRQAGATAAGLLAMAVGGRAKLAVISGSPTILCHAYRIEGFKSRAETRYPGLETVETVYNGDDEFESYEQTKRLLTEHPEIEALYMTAAGVFGACRAVLSMGREDTLKIVCFDTVATTREMIRKGVIAAAIAQQPQIQGKRSLGMLFEYVAFGTPIPEEFNYTENGIKIEENL